MFPQNDEEYNFKKEGNERSAGKLIRSVGINVRMDLGHRANSAFGGGSLQSLLLASLVLFHAKAQRAKAQKERRNGD